MIAIGYWSPRGLIEPIRLFLEYKTIPYEFWTPSADLYLGPPPTYSKVRKVSVRKAILIIRVGCLTSLIMLQMRISNYRKAKC